MKKLLVATMALAMLAGSATAALADHEAVGTGTNAGDCASFAHGLNLQQSATVLSDTSIRVSWTNWCSNEDRYNILRSATSGGTFVEIGSVAGVNGATADSLSYVDSSLAACTTYYYKVQAERDARGQSSALRSESAEFSAKTTGCVEGKPAQAIANGHLRPGSPAALQCESVLGSNWHGDVLSAAHVEFGTRKFAPSEEHEVTDWIDTDICA